MSNSKFTNLRSFSRFAVVITAVAFSSLFTSCSNDDDEKVNPEERIPFIGTYQVKDYNIEEKEEDNVYFSHKLYITASDKGADKVNLGNFRYINSGIIGKIKGNKIIIDQVMEDSDERVEIKGEGTLNGNQLNYAYKLVVKEKGKKDLTFENTAEATKVLEASK